MTAETTAPLAEGEIIAGKYRVGRVLGHGGMGVVVAATHLQLEQKVALKFLLPAALSQPEVVARFTREAQSAAKIQSEHVARVLDVGQLPTNAPYMVMEYLEGEDLEHALGRRGALPVAEAIGYLLEGCEAVAEAHALGIVHRDLKPANLFLARRPNGKPILKVLDFGISKSPAASGDPTLTQASAMFGSPPYMSPEQVRSTRSADVRSDIWSLGAVLYELLTGQRPFAAESAPALFVAILHQDPAMPSSHRSDIPPLVDAAVMRCLQKDPTHRFQDVAALAAAIAPFGPPSAGDSVVRISHVLGIMQRPAERVAAAPPPRAMAATLGMDATAASPVTAPAPMASTEIAPSPPAIVASRPRTTVPLPTTTPLPAPAPLAEPKASPPRGGAARLMFAVAAIVVVGVAGAGYLFGARRARSTPEGATPEGAVVHVPPPVPVPPPVAPPARVDVPPPAPAAPAAAAPAAKPDDRRAPAPRRKAVAAGPAPAAPPRGAGPPAARPAVCAELLERESLGETLTPREKAVYARECAHQ